jgi:aconitate hydratase
VDIDLQRDPLGVDPEGRPVFLRDLWPTGDEVAEAARLALDPALFAERYQGIERSNPEWNAIPIRGGDLYAFDPDSTYIQEPPFLASIVREPEPPRPIRGARVLVMVGDSITTDHISPAGAIAASSPAGAWLIEHGVEPRDFNSYGARRGNDRVMTRGTFANIRLRNVLAGGREGGFTAWLPNGEVMSIHEAAQRYLAAGTPTIVLAGRDYGMGSSRDWAAKGTLLLGVRAVIAQSYERIHRSNLVGMGVLPLQFLEGQDALSLGLTGREVFDIEVDADPAPGETLVVRATADDGTVREFSAICRLDSEVERDYYRHGGILPAVLRGFLAAGM